MVRERDGPARTETTAENHMASDDAAHDQPFLRPTSQTADTDKLAGVCVWLIGSIPEGTSAPDADRLRRFVRVLVGDLLEAGATVVHGSHPTIVPELNTVVRETRSTSRGQVKLVRSAQFENPPRVDPGIGVEETKKLASEDESLALMRSVLAAQADMAVALGGRWWNAAARTGMAGQAPTAGVPIEIELAFDRKLPTFVVGAFGGAAAGVVTNAPATLRRLNNGWSVEENRGAAIDGDIDLLASRIARQMAVLAAQRREALSKAGKRILALDGGGIRGVFTAAVLEAWEQRSGVSVAKKFDLITGTSTGGLLALGLGLGISPKEMVAFYVNHGPEIFPMMSFGDRVEASIRSALLEKFEAKTLETKLGVAFKGVTRTLAESPVRLAITSYNLDANVPVVYRTGHTSTTSCHDHLRAVVVGRATSAAPTYFKPAVVEDDLVEYEAIDGGMWANCPALVGLCEGIGHLGWPLESMRVLSVGTTCNPKLITPPKWSTGYIGWGKPAIGVLMLSQMQCALDVAGTLLGKRLTRVDSAFPTAGLDDVRSISKLKTFGERVAQAAWPQVEEVLSAPDAPAWR